MARDKTEHEKIEEALKEVRKIEEQNAVEKYKEKLAMNRAIARASERDAIEQSLIVGRDDKGNPSTAWDEAMRQANHIIQKDISTVNDWKNIMLSLMNMFSLLCDALHGTIDKNAIQTCKEIIIDRGILALKDHLFVTAPSMFDMPELIHNVNFTEDNKLKIAPIQRSDNVEHKDRYLKGKMDEINDLFEKGVVKWLKENGYTSHSTEKDQFVDKNGNLLTKQVFDDLKKDTDNGLERILSDSSNLVYRPSA